MKLLTVDFETFYSPTYSLSKLTTEEYIRGDEFEVIGVSVQVDGGVVEWFSGTHEETKKYLDQFAWGDSMMVAHNAMFDAGILSFVFGIHPKVIADTLSMARALHGITVGGSLKALVAHYNLGVKGDEVIHALGKRRLDFTPEELARYAAYCVNDTAITYKLFNELVTGYPKDELKLIDLTIKMFTRAVLRLDALALEKHLAMVQERKATLMEKVVGGVDMKKTIMSNPQFAELLRTYGVEPPMKVSLTTKKLTYAFAKTDPGLKELLDNPNPDVQVLVAARLGVKSTQEETRTKRFLDISQRGTLPIALKYYAAHTSRWGGMGNSNIQNLSARGRDAGALKKAILAPKGYVIIDCDSAQIEARILAWLSGQNDLVKAFANKEDVYKQMASKIYWAPEDSITPAQRFVGKAVVLGAGYGMGATRYQAQLKIYGVEMPIEDARHNINVYRGTYTHIPELWKQGDTLLAAMLDGQTAPYGRVGAIKLAWGMIHTPLGIPLRYHELRRGRDAQGKVSYLYTSRTGPKSIWGGGFTENVIQHLARIVIGQQMLRVAKRYQVVLTVHDAIACIAREEEALEARAYVEECMRWVPPWATGLPLNCESGMGYNYGEC